MKTLMNVSHAELSGKKGVYRLHCNDHTYIGSSKQLYRRLKSHYNSLKRDCHYNKFVQRVFNKYGSEVFFYEILELCDDYIAKETYYIKLLNSDMNVELDPSSKEKSESTKKKLSVSLLGRYTGKDNSVSVKIHQYSLSGKYMNSYDSIRAATKAVNGCKSSIADARNGRNKSAAGYQWFKYKYNKVKPVIAAQRNPRKYKFIILIDSEGKKIRKKDVSAAALFLKTSVQAVYQAINKDKTCKGAVIKLN